MSFKVYSMGDKKELKLIKKKKKEFETKKKHEFELHYARMKKPYLNV